MLNEKVIRLSQNEVSDKIEKFFYLSGLNSDNTRSSYERNIKRFFEEVKGKDVQFLTKQDIQLTMDDFIYFVKKMKDDYKLNPKTINHNITSVKELMRYLASEKDSNGEKFVEDISYLESTKRIRLKENKNKHGVLSIDEVLQMAELALHEKEKCEIKNKLILFSLDTCIRKEAALDLRWTDFEEREADVLVTYVDKGNKDFRPKISKKFYDELLTLKNGESEFVFDISSNGVDRMMARLKKIMDFPKSRKIVFHSIRKSGAVFQFRLHGDIMKAKAVLGHSNVNTTMDYLEDEKEGILGAVSSAGSVDLEAFKKVSHEDLLSAIDKLPKNVKYLISIALQKE